MIWFAVPLIIFYHIFWNWSKHVKLSPHILVCWLGFVIFFQIVPDFLDLVHRECAKVSASSSCDLTSGRGLSTFEPVRLDTTLYRCFEFPRCWMIDIFMNLIFVLISAPVYLLDVILYANHWWSSLYFLNFSPFISTVSVHRYTRAFYLWIF